jgi:hypothetical protein
MQNRDYPIPRVFCGAKTRVGGTCKQPAMTNGRCRLHGGKSLSGKQHGRYRRGEFTRDALANRQEIRAMRQMAKRGLLKPEAIYGITDNISRCACPADHYIIAQMLLYCRQNLDR